MKKPTHDDFHQHDGLHYHQLWNSIDELWCCPACGRSKFDIMKWTKRFPNSPNSFMGWVAALHKHHDHSVSLLGGRNPRFPETLICGQCNAADGTAKRILKLPSNFSYSPQEIRLFVQATPHKKHTINLDAALKIYKSLF